jgi:hypothetical protein
LITEPALLIRSPAGVVVNDDISLTADDTIWLMLPTIVTHDDDAVDLHVAMSPADVISSVIAALQLDYIEIF